MTYKERYTLAVVTYWQMAHEWPDSWGSDTGQSLLLCPPQLQHSYTENTLLWDQECAEHIAELACVKNRVYPQESCNHQGNHIIKITQHNIWTSLHTHNPHADLNDKCENDLPSMKPVLTNVTFDHEACHIVWQATQAVHWHWCHILCVYWLVNSFNFGYVKA